MSLGWILGLLGGSAALGAGLLAAAALMGFLPPTVWANLLQTVRWALGLVLSALRWLVFTADGRQVLLLLLGLFGFWWSGQRGWDRGVAWKTRQDADAALIVKGANRSFVINLTAADVAVKLDLATGLAQIRRTFAQINKEIPKHVTPQIDRAYPLPCGLVRVWDAGALDSTASEVASSRCASDAAAAPTKASALSQASTQLWEVYWKTKADDEAVRKLYRNLTGNYEKLRTDWGKARRLVK